MPAPRAETCRSVAIMGGGQGRERAIGWYWPSRLYRIGATVVGLVWIFLGRPLESGAAWPWLASGVALLALAWCIPVVVVTATEVRLVRRFTTIRWVDVTMVFQPAPGDPIRIRRSDGKLFVLPGVGLDRLPEILALATQDSAEPRA